MYDFIIAGAGPGGSTLARLLGKNFKVLLLEKKKLINNEMTREKVCGGLLAPDAQKALGSLGLGIPLSVLTGPQLFGVRSIDLEENLEQFYQRFYININRKKFDHWLISLINDTVDIRYGSTMKYFSENNTNVEVEFLNNGKIFKEKCRYLIGGDGSLSRVREILTGHSIKTLPSYIALQQSFEKKTPDSHFSVFFDHNVTDFYSWIIPKEESFVLGAALPYSKNIFQKFQLLQEKTQNWGYNFKRSIKTESAWIIRPKNNTIHSGTQRVLLIGEAAGLISPSSAEGISYAIRSALYLSKAADLDIDNLYDEYNKNLTPLKRNIFFKNLKSPFMYNRFLRKQILKSGIMSIKNEGDIPCMSLQNITA